MCLMQKTDEYVDDMDSCVFTFLTTLGGKKTQLQVDGTIV